MNTVLSQDGSTLVTETSINEAHLLYSILEFVSRYKPIQDRMLQSEVEFAGELAEELKWYLEEVEQDFIVE